MYSLNLYMLKINNSSLKLGGEKFHNIKKVTTSRVVKDLEELELSYIDSMGKTMTIF